MQDDEAVVTGRDPVELAWAAGFLDGEGHFGIRAALHTPYIEAAQVGLRAPLDRLVALLGGSVVRKHRPAAARPLYRWAVTGGAQLRDALPLLIPFLCVKHDEARLVLMAALLTPKRGTNQLPPLLSPLREANRVELLHLRATKGTPCKA